MFFYCSYFISPFIYKAFRAFLSLLTTHLIATDYTMLSLLATHSHRYWLHANIATGYTKFQSFSSHLRGCGNLFECLYYITPVETFCLPAGKVNQAVFVFSRKEFMIYFLVFCKTRLPENHEYQI